MVSEAFKVHCQIPDLDYNMLLDMSGTDVFKQDLISIVAWLFVVT